VIEVRSAIDEEVARRYDMWLLSPAGRYVERSENQLILDLLQPNSRQSVLDVGCGTGNHLLFFRQLGLDASGIDSSETMLRIARDKLGDRVALRTGVAEDLPFDDNEFDLVTLITALEFCEHPYRALAEACRVAREKVFIGVLNLASTNAIHRKVEDIVRTSWYRKARFYSYWELRYMIHRVLGVCRVSWGSAIWLPFAFHRWDEVISGWIPRRRNPFGAFLGVQIEVIYTHQAKMIPLTARWAGNASPEAHPGTLAGIGRNLTPLRGEPDRRIDSLQGGP
jgi:ubiquinone/menaquinone biosynthesis C-methylase UbiE